jgi:predicted ATP-dependent endonuclease of OLD family
MLRTDFRKHCAYCTCHEEEIGGEENFEIDHHRPKLKFQDLENDYSNLYYCCHACNRRGAKGENWPTDEQIAQGFKFIDPVVEDPYEIHLEEKPNGILIERSNTGKYSIDKLRLNRDSLVRLRNRRKQMRNLLSKELKKLLKTIEKLKMHKKNPSPEILERFKLVTEKLHNYPVLQILPSWWI